MLLTYQIGLQILHQLFLDMFRKLTINSERYLEKLEGNPDVDRNETLEHFIKSHGYSELFQKGHLVRLIIVHLVQEPILLNPF